MAKSRCSVVEDGFPCDNDAAYASPACLCPKHYQRWKRLGRPDAPVQEQVRGRSPEERRQRKNAWARMDYARNPEAVRNRQRRYAAEHPERVREWSKVKRARKLQRDQGQLPRRRSARQGEELAGAVPNVRKRWEKTPPDKVASDRKRWRANNPERWRESDRVKTRRRRARLKGLEVVPYRDVDIFERDRWVCQLCRKKVDKRYRYPNAKAATIDHIVPIALGGADAPANVQLAHFGCNSAKNIRAMGEQLRLIG